MLENLNKSKIVVAMSGGVDSSVCAAWLKQMGHDVIGVSLQLHDMAKTGERFGSCCSLSDISDARRIADAFKFPFYVADMEREFREDVIENFVEEYLSGRTPNPCVKCNEKVKISKLLRWARELGADYLATGHYARVYLSPESGQYELHKGSDSNKDQSYFLFTMTASELSRTLFPIGNLDKPQVRDLAKKLGLKVAEKPESQEICFVQSRNYSEFIETRVAPSLLEAGNIVDKEGKILGQHAGIHKFTIGQRKGIGAASPNPMYVVALRKQTNEVVVGPESDLFQNRCLVRQLHWISPPDFAGGRAFEAKIRYRTQVTPVKVFPLLDRRAEVEFSEPQRAITPGQAIVFYRGEQVMGGGWIEDFD